MGAGCRKALVSVVCFSLFQDILMITSEAPFVHLIITVRKRCLRQGNVFTFTRVCLPPRGRGLPPGESASTGVCIQGGSASGGS